MGAHAPWAKGHRPDLFILIHQCRISQQLLQGIYSQLVVDVAVVVPDGAFLDSGGILYFLDGFAGNVIIEYFPLLRGEL